MSKNILFYLVLILCSQNAFSKQIVVLPESGPVDKNHSVIDVLQNENKDQRKKSSIAKKSLDEQSKSIPKKRNKANEQPKTIVVLPDHGPIDQNQRVVELNSPTDKKMDTVQTNNEDLALGATNQIPTSNLPTTNSTQNPNNVAITKAPKADPAESKYKQRGGLRLGITYSNDGAYGYSHIRDSSGNYIGGGDLKLASGYGVTLQYFVNTNSFVAPSIALSYDPKRTLKFTDEYLFPGATYSNKATLSTTTLAANVNFKLGNFVYIPLGVLFTSIQTDGLPAGVSIEAKGLGLQLGLGAYLGNALALEVVLRSVPTVNSINSQNPYDPVYDNENNSHYVNTGLRYIF